MIERIYFWRKLWNATQGHLISLVYFIQSSKMTPHFNTILRRETILTYYYFFIFTQRNDICMSFGYMCGILRHCEQWWILCMARLQYLPKLLNWEKRSFSLFASNGIYFFFLYCCTGTTYGINTTVPYVEYILIICITIFCHGTSLKKKNIWPRGDSNIYLHTYFTHIINI